MGMVGGFGKVDQLVTTVMRSGDIGVGPETTAKRV